MNIKALAALPLIAVLGAGPVAAGTLGGAVSDPDLITPIVPVVPVGGLNIATVAAGVVGAAVLISVLGGSDDTTEETLEPAAQ